MHATKTYGVDVAEALNVFVGTDESQMLACRVLDYSIRRYSTVPVRVQPMLNMNVPIPRHCENRQRTGFSFSRFLIPSLCGFKGRAVYMDADMLVFGDIAELAVLPFPEGISLMYVEQLSNSGRASQFSVMVLDCEKLQWDIHAIVAQLDTGAMTYDQLMFEFSHLPEDVKSACLPSDWNVLEQYNPGCTALLHYTDMNHQPWVNGENPNGDLWYAALREAIKDRYISEAEVAAAINDGHVSPRLVEWLGISIEGVLSTARGWQPPFRRLAPSPWRRLVSRVERWANS